MVNRQIVLSLCFVQMFFSVELFAQAEKRNSIFQFKEEKIWRKFVYPESIDLKFVQAKNKVNLEVETSVNQIAKQINKTENYGLLQLASNALDVQLMDSEERNHYFNIHEKSKDSVVDSVLHDSISYEKRMTKSLRNELEKKVAERKRFELALKDEDLQRKKLAERLKMIELEQKTIENKLREGQIRSINDHALIRRHHEEEQENELKALLNEQEELRMKIEAELFQKTQTKDKIQAKSKKQEQALKQELDDERNKRIQLEALVNKKEVEKNINLELSKKKFEVEKIRVQELTNQLESKVSENKKIQALLEDKVAENKLLKKPKVNPELERLAKEKAKILKALNSERKKRIQLEVLVNKKEVEKNIDLELSKKKVEEEKFRVQELTNQLESKVSENKKIQALLADKVAENKLLKKPKVNPEMERLAKEKAKILKALSSERNKKVALEEMLKKREKEKNSLVNLLEGTQETMLSLTEKHEKAMQRQQEIKKQLEYKDESLGRLKEKLSQYALQWQKIDEIKKNQSKTREIYNQQLLSQEAERQRFTEALIQAESERLELNAELLQKVTATNKLKHELKMKRVEQNLYRKKLAEYVDMEKELMKRKAEQKRLEEKFMIVKQTVEDRERVRSEQEEKVRKESGEKIDFITQTLYQKGISELSLGKTTSALESLKKVLKRNPSYHPARELLSKVLYKSGYLKEAYNLLNLGLFQDPRNISYNTMMARVLMRLDQSSRALNLLERNAPPIQKSEDYYAILCALYMQKKDYESANHFYKKLVKQYPYSTDFLLGYALSSEQLDMPKIALNTYKRALNTGQINLKAARFIQDRIKSLAKDHQGEVKVNESNWLNFEGLSIIK